jgi:hypothetical protein
MTRDDHMIAQARSNAGPQLHLVDNWVAAYTFACEDGIDEETQNQAEALVRYVANLDKTPTRTMLLQYAKKLGL